MALLNTHATVKKFMSFGAKEDLAEAIVEAINDQNNELATKSQLAHTEAALKSDIALVEANLKSEIALRSDMNSLKTELKSEISTLHNKIETVESRLEAKIEKLETTMKIDIGWLKALNLAILTTVLGIAFAPLAQNMFKAPAQEVIPSKNK